jgi:hypothetical protein
VLISGSQKPLDLADLQRHTRYSGGLHSLDSTAKRFWAAVASMTEEEKGKVLQFVTSCERPPLLGFQAMTPAFTLHRVGISSDSDKLPSASTCFNMLKLPTYSSQKVMKEKLLYAVTSGAGFEMS